MVAPAANDFAGRVTEAAQPRLVVRPPGVGRFEQIRGSGGAISVNIRDHHTAVTPLTCECNATENGENIPVFNGY